MSINQLTRFTSTARQALLTSHREAALEKSPTIDTRHLLIGLVQLPVDESTAAHILNQVGITAEKLKSSKIEPRIHCLGLSEGVKRSLEWAAAVAQDRQERLLASGHLLAGVLEDPSVSPILEYLSITREQVINALDSLQPWIDEGDARSSSASSSRQLKSIAVFHNRRFVFCVERTKDRTATLYGRNNV